MALPTSVELLIVTPDKLLVKAQVDEVEIPGTEGYFGVLPGHTPMLASLSVGELWYRKGQEKTYLSLAYGFAEVLPERVTILAQLAERAEDIDVARAEEAKPRAEAQLVQAKDIDYERARRALMKSLPRLQVAPRGQFAGRARRPRARPAPRAPVGEPPAPPRTARPTTRWRTPPICAAWRPQRRTCSPAPAARAWRTSATAACTGSATARSRR